MREILFRGKRKDNDKWAYGYLYIRNDGQYEISFYSKYFDSERFTYDVIPETVGQYTGLTDKNGKKIFEGDILRRAYHPYEDVAIEWFDGSFRFREVNKPKDYGYSYVCCVQNAVSRLKIIGNIYNNPELNC